MIWCVEDDASIRDIEVYALQSTGFEAKGFEDGDSFLSALKTEIPDLVILDVMLPGTDGIEALKIMKSTAEYVDIPVIMATAKGAEFDKVQGLDMGADDYLVKPFGMMEMISRVKAVMRRCKPKTVTRVLQIRGLQLNLDERTVSINGERISLTYKEFELLKMFMKNLGMVFSRDTLYNEIWGADFVGETRTVDAHIRTLRQKLDSFASQPHSIWSDFPMIDMAARRLQKVVIENKDFEKLIRQYDRPVSFFYCDPPYFATENYYKDVGFTTKDHIRLRDTLLGISGKFLVSYNDCPEIRELWDKPGIYIEEISRINNLAQRYDGGCQYAELLISNYDTSERAKMVKQLSFFDENGGLII